MEISNYLFFVDFYSNNSSFYLFGDYQLGWLLITFILLISLITLILILSSDLDLIELILILFKSMFLVVNTYRKRYRLILSKIPRK
jgi:hypothetical protein